MKKLTWKKVWHFIWVEDSIASWIVNIVLALILIKFIIYPGIGLALGTKLPVVAVISESMEHRSKNVCEKYDMKALECIKYSETKFEICGAKIEEKKTLDLDEYWNICGWWYKNLSISLDRFSSFPMKNGFNKGDIIILKGIDYENIKVGDVVVFQSNLNYPIIHRVVEKNDVIQTKGDHNKAQIEDTKLNEKYITKEQIIGRAWIRIPYLGYIKIWAVDLLRCATFQGCRFE